MKVIFIDDELWTMEYLEKAISWESLDVEIIGKALNGKEAIVMIKENPPDIAIVDIKMPVMDGIDFMEWVHNSIPQLKTIVLSAYGEFEYARKALSFGAVGYLLKPVEEKKLLKVVSKAIEIILQERQLHQLIENTDKIQSINEPGSIQYCRFVQQVTSFIRDHYDQPLTLEEIALQAGLSPNYLCRLYKQETEQNLWDYITSYRMEKAKKLLNETNLKTYEVAYKVGFDNPNYFSKIFKKHTGISPQKFRS